MPKYLKTLEAVGDYVFAMLPKRAGLFLAFYTDLNDGLGLREPGIFPAPEGQVRR